ncbi:hypothetical protein MTR_2g027325 [Medicago truncatula]|uniref:Uncharacterized protein n=1 Tax=Medicago truncatula TaxID=3880 RepID=A0A072V6M2_MEDTR|nr:hypothetical protein MTR_2g027325 [Medicago truncatula]
MTRHLTNEIKTRFLLMSNINAIFAGMTRHPTNTASSLSFHIVHLGPNASNWWTTFLCPTHGLVGNHLQSFIIRPICMVVNHVKVDVVYGVYTLIREFVIDKSLVVVTKARTYGNDMPHV